jgi:hypothetical protein
MSTATSSRYQPIGSLVQKGGVAVVSEPLVSGLGGTVLKPKIELLPLLLEPGIVPPSGKAEKPLVMPCTSELIPLEVPVVPNAEVVPPGPKRPVPGLVPPVVPVDPG